MNISKSKKKFPYDPMALFWVVFAWITGLIPMVQKAVAAADPNLVPFKVFSTVADAFFGLDDQPSALWTFLMKAKPDGITDAQHEANQELAQDSGLLVADLVDYIPEAVAKAKAAGVPADEVIVQIRHKVNELLDEHEFEADIQAVIDAK